MTSGGLLRIIEIEGVYMRISIVLLSLLFLVSACTNTELVSSWSTPHPTKYNKLLVVGISKDAGTRRIFEDNFVKDAANSQFTAIASYPYAPESGKIDRVRLEEIVTKTSADAVLIIRLITVDRQMVSTPPRWVPSAGPRYGYYDTAWNGYYEPGTTYEQTTIILDVKVYDSRTGELVWTGTTRTIDPYNLDAEIQKVCELIVNKMVDDKLVGGKGS